MFALGTLKTMKITTSGVCTILYLAYLMCQVQSYPQYRDELPNGYNVMNPCNHSEIWNGVGHENKLGGGPRNPFGLAFAANNHKYDATLCEMDSDGDGRTNGDELGDPNCTFTKGSNPSRTTNITHPGICDPLNSPACHGKNTFLKCETFNCPAVTDPAVTKLDLKFPRTEVPAQETTYMCMAFELPSDKKYHAVATKPIIDNIMFPHHMLLFGCSTKPTGDIMTRPEQCQMLVQGCKDLIGAWTVGLEGNCLPNDVGFAIGQGGIQYAVLQIHWNNLDNMAGQYDASGLSLFYTDQLRPNEAIIFMVGQEYLVIPPGQSDVVAEGSCSSKCTNTLGDKKLKIIMGALHMHLLGRSGKAVLVHDGVEQVLIESDYDYNSPKIVTFNPYFDFDAGDSIKMTCRYDSTGKNTTTYYGEGTRDEMCYVFLVIIPPVEGFLTCGQYKSEDVCTTSDNVTYVEQGCDVERLKYSFGAIGQTCTMDCSPQCMQSIKMMNDTKCFDVEIGGYIRNFWPSKNSQVKQALQVADYCSAKAAMSSTSAGPAGPSSAGPGGPSSAGPGGPSSAGPGGPSSAGPGGASSAGPGGPSSAGPGGPSSAGPGGASSAGPDGQSSTKSSDGSGPGDGGSKRKTYEAVIISSVVVGAVAAAIVCLAACCT